MKSAAFDVKIRKIENGYVLSWYEGDEDEFNTPFIEYYAPSLEDMMQRIRTLFHKG